MPFVFLFALVGIASLPLFLIALRDLLVWFLDSQGIPLNVAWAIATGIVKAIWYSLGW